MLEPKKGTIKREIATVEIKGYEVPHLIINTLVEQGYDLEIKPVLNEVLHSK